MTDDPLDRLRNIDSKNKIFGLVLDNRLSNVPKFMFKFTCLSPLANTII